MNVAQGKAASAATLGSAITTTSERAEHATVGGKPPPGKPGTLIGRASPTALREGIAQKMV